MDTRTVRSANAMHLANFKALGLPYEPLPNSTLNQKWKISENVKLRPGEYPNIGYLAIGRKGAKFSTTSDFLPEVVQLPHSPEDNALFDFIPFCVRRLDDDLKPEERGNLRGRVVFNDKKGVPHVAYMLMKMDTSKIMPTLEIRHVQDGVTSSKTYEPKAETLSPKPRFIPNVDVVTPNGDYLVATAKVNIELGPQEIGEILNAFTILNGTAGGSFITEVAVVTGVDREVPGASVGISGTYVEVICAQVTAFLHDIKYINENTSKIRWKLDVGSSEMLVL